MVKQGIARLEDTCICKQAEQEIVEKGIVIQPSSVDGGRCWKRIRYIADMLKDRTTIYVAMPGYGSDDNQTKKDIIEGIGDHSNVVYLRYERHLTEDLPGLLRACLSRE